MVVWSMGAGRHGGRSTRPQMRVALIRVPCGGASIQHPCTQHPGTQHRGDLAKIGLSAARDIGPSSSNGVKDVCAPTGPLQTIARRPPGPFGRLRNLRLAPEGLSWCLVAPREALAKVAYVSRETEELVTARVV